MSLCGLIQTSLSSVVTLTQPGGICLVSLMSFMFLQITFLIPLKTWRAVMMCTMGYFLNIYCSTMTPGCSLGPWPWSSWNIHWMNCYPIQSFLSWCLHSMAAFRWLEPTTFRIPIANGWCWSLGFLSRDRKWPLRFVFRMWLVWLIQFKFIHYLQIVRLACMGFGSSATCSRCGLRGVDLSHMFWDCPVLCSFWQDLFLFFETTLHLPVARNLEIGLLGILKDFVPHRQTHAHILLRMLLFYFTWIDFVTLEQCCFTLHPTVL